MSRWHTREQPGILHKGEVHLWIVPVNSARERLLYFKSILSPHETERAQRYRNMSDRERYAIARGSLRHFLAAYGAGEADRLQFTHNAFGKPSLSSQASEAALNFSVSHSGDQILIGFVRGRRIGVDVEYVRRDIDVLGLAKSYFSPEEFQRLRILPQSEQCEAFYRAWTRKEAYLKGCGEGLSSGLERVEVSFMPAERAIIRKTTGVCSGSERWTLKHLSLAAGYVGAAAVESRNAKFKFFRWVKLPPQKCS